MTEAEARTKWCPFTRVPVLTRDGTAASNRSIADVDPRHVRCITTGCMAWVVTDWECGRCGLVPEASS